MQHFPNLFNHVHLPSLCFFGIIAQDSLLITSEKAQPLWLLIRGRESNQDRRLS